MLSLRRHHQRNDCHLCRLFVYCLAVFAQLVFANTHFRGELLLNRTPCISHSTVGNRGSLATWQQIPQFATFAYRRVDRVFLIYLCTQ